ncbi:potassium-transporting ATPase subunit KdpC [Streptomyces sp. ISL-43]|uniref:potassium-transporting ATPase subunit KdpC n=1 Tax=Streptomyces sp. ISL-43 TaxID=2819183 RepID=UPI001BE5C0F4|nr:potassium-transporting ATPase subunit KdpC [Streptomyces sp. ISL-43]MBT2446236.1 potassium-transporting ATPase subunit KdpC [Streptomyces sp. ISL-43]
MNNSVGNTARLLGAGLRALLVLTVLCGVLYPLAVTGVAQAAFGHQANGSEIEDAGGRVVGSSLIGQPYGDDPRWFQGRPAAGLSENTLNTRYGLLVSGATNKAADSPELLKAVREAKAEVVLDNTVPGYTPQPSRIPADAVTSSGSGLDPNISPAYAELQTHRVAARNHLPVAEVTKLVEAHTEGRTLGFMGEPRVNVLELNVALKALAEK